MIAEVRRYEDFSVGDVYRSAVGRTVTEWGRPLVNSTFTLALVLGLSVPDTTQAGGINLGWKEIRLPKPVFVGDTIRSETEVLSVRESNSRPAQGIVSVRTRGRNQREEIVCEF